MTRKKKKEGTEAWHFTDKVHHSQEGEPRFFYREGGGRSGGEEGEAISTIRGFNFYPARKGGDRASREREDGGGEN